VETRRQPAARRNLASALDDARVAAFVGREQELAAFESALTGAGTQRVLFVHGPGGIGKTTLLHRLRIIAERAECPVVHLDARDIDCSPESFLAAFADGRRAAVVGQTDPADAGDPAPVLLLDGYDRLKTLDHWLRTAFLPSLRSDSVVVLVGREPPGAAWRTDPGWRAVATVCRLDPLTDEESLDLLARCAVPDDGRPRLTRLGGGHPMTLALLADSASTAQLPDDLTDAPDLVAALATHLVGEAPSEAHAQALALCSVSWLTGEDLLGMAIGAQAAQVWPWLESRPFITRGADGLYPHDLVREVLEADLRRRSPQRYREVVGIVHRHAIESLRSNDSATRVLGAHQKLYLHRRGPLYGSFWALRERGAAAVLAGRPEDHPETIELIRRHEGAASAAIAARWLEAQPEGLFVVRSPNGIAGYFLQVLYPADPALVDADPVLDAAVGVANGSSPARPGEQISIGRFLGGRTALHQRDAYAVLASCVGSTITWVRRPLAWSFVTSIDDEFWVPNFSYLGLNPYRTVTFDGRQHTIFGIDWRRVPIDGWLDLMADRELTGEHGPVPPEMMRPEPLSRHDFNDAVRSALRDLSRPDRLAGSALMSTQLVGGHDADPTGRLRAGVLEAIAVVDERDVALGRVLDRTFVRAALTQESAAEVLDLPFSTYRRHLARAIEELTDVLWSVEINAGR